MSPARRLSRLSPVRVTRDASMAALGSETDRLPQGREDAYLLRWRLRRPPPRTPWSRGASALRLLRLHDQLVVSALGGAAVPILRVVAIAAALARSVD